MSTPSAEPIADTLPATGWPSGLVAVSDPAGTDPIRAELYGLDALERYAHELATCCSQANSGGSSDGQLLRRLRQNHWLLFRAYRHIAEVAGRNEPLSPDAEWLLDNFYVIAEVLRAVRTDLPPSYYRELPRLCQGPLRGYPRVYALALSLIAHTDSSLDEAHITRFVHAYQEVTPLTIGELWAVPASLRLGLLENLRRLAERMLATWDEHRRAEAWAAPLTAPSADDGQAPGMSGVRRRPPVVPPLPERLTDPFVVRCVQVLRNAGATSALEVVDRRLAERGFEAAEVVRRENQRQAVNQVSVGNCVTSLRLLAALDWGAFFERTNLVDPALREDPAGVYPVQDFATRDSYRRAVEKLARRAPLTEVEVARRAVETARAGAGTPANHVGHYLVGRGLPAFRAAIGYRPRLRDRLLDTVLAHPNTVYFGSIVFWCAVFFALIALLVRAADTAGTFGVGHWVLLLLGTLLPVSDLAVGVTHYLLTLYLPPRVLPKLDFKNGIAPDCTTFVVIPSMLTRADSGATLLEKLEVHYLANSDPQLRFALLTDFADAPAEHMPDDEKLVRGALDAAEALNRRYAPTGPPRFYVFHRRRLWNPAQGCWMGWERKRGKLTEFNRLLRGDRTTTYTVCGSDPAELPHVRFVITLDQDTEMPRDAARRMVGTLAHPLNRPRFDAEQGRVVEGYGVLQPRVSFHLKAANRTLFTRIFAASAGVDPYATAVSDVYEDLFGAGSFTGKGVYDVDAFEAATGHTFPENHILSHDLIEGNFARCGLVTDIELFDDFPSRYHAYARREYRWIRGDWQLLPWLGRRVPVPAAPGQAPGTRPNPLPALERWKVLDNLRRSLVPPALVLWLTLCWTVLPVGAWLAAGLALVVLALPLILPVFGTLVGFVRSGSLAPVREFRHSLPATAGQVALSGVFLLNQAYVAVDAVVRTVWRSFVSRRRLLEWETAAVTDQRLGGKLTHFWRSMWQTPALVLGLGALVLLIDPPSFSGAAPFLAGWLLSPLVAWWVSRPGRLRVTPLTAAERQELRRIARRTWNFFETFVGDADHWLPPDNFQEEPEGRIAHRTSPTNQGLLLVSTLAARDLGYLTIGTLVDRLEKTVDTLERLERFRGHFLNWYDTRTLAPLPPAYVSTVDSGNLLASLLTLKQGLLEVTREPVVGPAADAGLADTLGVLGEILHAAKVPTDPEPALWYRDLDAGIRAAAEHLTAPVSDLAALAARLTQIERNVQPLQGLAARLKGRLGPAAADLDEWAGRAVRQVGERREELVALAPWLGLPTVADGTAGDPDGRREKLRTKLIAPFNLAGFRDGKLALLAELEAVAKSGTGPEPWLRQLREAVEASQADALMARCRALADRADALAKAMDFRFLYKPERDLFAIGYSVPQMRLDASCYDLLASEARLASFLAVARGDAPPKHWFLLGRLLTKVDDRLCLLSWGGTQFEYLMPRLFLRDFPGTLLSESERASADWQIVYGRKRGVPWGISESAFSSQYASFDYQYQSFGVPGLGLKRGLGQDLVIAPYATALAVPLYPHEALRNFKRLAREGASGRYGFYEAVDYTRSRLPEGRRSLVVRCFMAHHQGMSLLALTNGLLGDPMPRRFHADPIARATELLLQERVPRAATPTEAPEAEAMPRTAGAEGPDLVSRRLTSPATPGPRTHLLSNGHYTVMVTNAGSGFSRYGALDVTRWREDFTRDSWGQFCYVRDMTANLLWSAGHQPVGRTAEHYEVLYSTDKAEFRRLDGTVATHLEIAVSPESHAEVRRVTLTNHDTRPHELELTSYAELVLAPHGADLAHPAFAKLFVETEWAPEHDAVLARTRPRAPEDKPVWAVHVATADGPNTGGPQFETDRARFLGRGRTPASPAALERGAALSNSAGPVLDPIFSLRRRVRVPPGGSASVLFCTAVAETREEALRVADRFRDPAAVLRVFDLAWAHSQVELRHLRLTTADAHLCQRLAAHLLYAGPGLRAAAAVLAGNRLGQPALWRYGISGDRPILLARITTADGLPLARQLLGAHSYWRLKGLEVDLLLLSEEAGGYFEELHRELMEAVRASDAHDRMDRPGGVFVRKWAQVSEEDRAMLLASARVVLYDDRGTLAAQLDRADRIPQLPAAFVPVRSANSASGLVTVRLPPDLRFGNGHGGFTADGREYCVLAYPTAGPALPPAPWVNVMANPVCGFLASESTLGPAWVGNSQQYRLTPWSNDPVSDPPSQAVYLRDEDTGETWTPTPRPLGQGAPTLARHGQGYTRYERRSHGLVQDLLAFVPTEDPLQIIVLTVQNTGYQTRHLCVTFYAELVLGTPRDQAAQNVRTAVDAESGALLAHNVFNPDFAAEVAFADVSLRPRTVTGDRTEFLGRNGSAAAPAALRRVSLSGRTGAGLDPCVALQVKLDLRSGEEREVVFFLGAAPGPDAARALVRRYREPGRARAAFAEVTAFWDRTLAAIHMQTPEPALDVLVNRWLPYQVLACRVWGRTALYQSGGAYGFRDQLQDGMALVYAVPNETRAHLLRAAAHQFREGDVQHWWHPPSSRGVRTRISDDYLWLPFAVAQYVAVTADLAVLDESVPFLRAPLLRPDQDEDYGLPELAEHASLYEHCVRALEHGLRFGAHGLPLMGTGDWNDGMNRVGVGGKGESIWLGWFLHACLTDFAPLVEVRGDNVRAASYREHAEKVREAIEQTAWDGAWYRRAYFDDGAPLGSAQNDECQIDSIAQTWAVLSRAGEPGRARQALDAVWQRLVRPDDGLVLLFTPPFDKGSLQPGYIKGYIPGIRENGGQYTHAATWAVYAAALSGEGDRAVQLLDMLNPIRHSATPQLAARYRVEPYVVAADIYGEPPNTGRGGWTWYTGSAAWLYRAVLEAVLGFRLRGARLELDPCVASAWPSFGITLRYRTATYHIAVENPSGVQRGVRTVELDGRSLAGRVIELYDDGRSHDIRVVLGADQR